MQNTKNIKQPIFSDKVVLISKQEYDRLYRENVAYKVMQAKEEIKEGKVFTHEEVFAEIDEMLADID